MIQQFEFKIHNPLWYGEWCMKNCEVFGMNHSQPNTDMSLTFSWRK